MHAALRSPCCPDACSWPQLLRLALLSMPAQEAVLLLMEKMQLRAPAGAAREWQFLLQLANWAREGARGQRARRGACPCSQTLAALCNYSPARRASNTCAPVGVAMAVLLPDIDAEGVRLPSAIGAEQQLHAASTLLAMLDAASERTTGHAVVRMCACEAHAGGPTARLPRGTGPAARLAAGWRRAAAVSPLPRAPHWYQPLAAGA